MRIERTPVVHGQYTPLAPTLMVPVGMRYCLRPIAAEARRVRLLGRDAMGAPPGRWRLRPATGEIPATNEHV